VLKTNVSLVLASQSAFRKESLARLNVPFTCISPQIDETRQINEPIDAMVLRLGIEKAAKIRATQPNAIIIASDQSAECEGVTLGKPGNHDNALAQLTLMQGKTVSFYTSLILAFPDGNTQSHVDITRVHFRQLNQSQLNRYLTIEQPYQCAGAFKSEGLGIALFDRIDNLDPSALIGLPMIKLSNWLTDAGILLGEPCV
jgi:septum formation protein